MQLRFYIDLKFQPFFHNTLLDGSFDILHKAAQRIVLIHQIYLSGFNLGQIQNITDDRKQRFTGILDIHGIFLDMRLSALPEHQFIHTQDRI